MKLSEWLKNNEPAGEELIIYADKKGKRPAVMIQPGELERWPLLIEADILRTYRGNREHSDPITGRKWREPYRLAIIDRDEFEIATGRNK